MIRKIKQAKESPTVDSDSTSIAVTMLDSDGNSVIAITGTGTEPPPSHLKAITKPGKSLSITQLHAIELLVSRTADIPLQAICERCGCHRQSLWRWMRRSTKFNTEYKAKVEANLGLARGKVAKALVEGATRPGPGQASMQKIYWERLGELVTRSEISGPGGGPIQVESAPISLDRLEVWLQALVVHCVEGKEFPEGLKKQIMSVVGIIDVTGSEYRQELDEDEDEEPNENETGDQNAENNS